MSAVDYTPCPHCAVNNIPDRKVCWQCGMALPMAYGPDGHARGLSKAEREQLRCEEIEALFSQAQMIDMESASENSEDLDSLQRAKPDRKVGSNSGRIAKLGLWPWKRRQSEVS